MMKILNISRFCVNKTNYSSEFKKFDKSMDLMYSSTLCEKLIHVLKKLSEIVTGPYL